MTDDYDASEDYDALVKVYDLITEILELDYGQLSEETRRFLVNVRGGCDDRMTDIRLEEEE